VRAEEDAASDPGALRAALARAESERVALRELLELAGDAGRMGTWSIDLVARQGRWDRRMRRIWGLPEDEERALPPTSELLRRVHEDERDAIAAQLLGSFRSPGRHACRVRIVDADGNVRRASMAWQVRAGAEGSPATVAGVMLDDTETFELGRAKDQALATLELATELAGVALWRHDLRTNRLHYSEQGWHVLGLPPRAEGLSLQEVRALIHPDDLPAVVASAERALAVDEPVDVEARYRRADGRWRDVMMRRVVERDAAGRPIAFLGVGMDVTDRASEARRAMGLARRFELATRTAGIGWWTLEDHAERAQWSDELRALHGLVLADTIPTLPTWLGTFVHPEDRDRVRSAFAAWMRAGVGSVRLDFRIVQRGGAVRHVLTHSRIESAEGQRLLFGVVIDVSDRVDAARALREANERTAMATRGAGLGTWELDLESGESLWDRQMWVLRGIEPAGAAPPPPPSPEARLAMVHPEDRAAVTRQFESLFGDTPMESHEFRVVRPDGEVRWLASRSAIVPDAGGRRRRRIGVNWDVTDSRAAEDARREREIAQRESRAKSRFLSRMSHELRTPLNAVLGFAQLLLAEDAAADPGAATRRRRLEHIRAAGQHLLTLIDDVLDLSSLEGGELRIAAVPVPLAPLVAATLPLVQPQAVARGVTVRTGALAGTPLADPLRLRQVLLNLLSNAVKYNRERGRVTVEAERRGQVVVLRVTDTGRGMTDAQLRHLFEPFNRLGIEREGIEGTGIGLAIVKTLAERMGGSVHVDSRAGEGSVFEVRLPAAGEAAPAPGPDDPAPAGPVTLASPWPEGGTAGRRPASILYVEDNPVNALIVAELVAREPGLVLRVATSGLEGVAAAAGALPDLVLLDMQLPDIDGHEVLRRLRGLPGAARLPVIALSANAMPADIERALAAGLLDYWTKPLDFGLFHTTITRLFGAAR
jgi:hypothetical protein